MAIHSHPEALLSPCKGVCILEGSECIGCGRTIDEIKVWMSISAAEKKRIIRLAAKRLASKAHKNLNV